MNNPAPGPRRDDETVRSRQLGRARVMGLLLGGFAVLLFLITLAKLGLNQ